VEERSLQEKRGRVAHDKMPAEADAIRFEKRKFEREKVRKEAPGALKKLDKRPVKVKLDLNNEVDEPFELDESKTNMKDLKRELRLSDDKEERKTIRGMIKAQEIEDYQKETGDYESQDYELNESGFDKRKQPGLVAKEELDDIESEMDDIEDIDDVDIPDADIDSDGGDIDEIEKEED